MYSQVIAVIKKECLDAFRDGKSLSTALLVPILFAAMTFGTTTFLVSMKNDSQGFTLAVSGSQYATPLVNWLEESGITITQAPENARQKVTSGELDLLLNIPKDFVDDFRQQRQASIELISDHSHTESQAKAGQLRQLIAHWSAKTGALRLITRNISPNIAQPVSLKEINVVSEERIAAKILSGLPLTFMMIVFVTGLGMASDMAAGERERKSLEPLLINPISHNLIFLGKWGAGVLVTAIISCIGIGLQFISVKLAPMTELGLKVNLGVSDYLLTLLILLPVMFFATSIQLLVSFFSRSFKDAQTYSGLIMLLPVIPGMYLIFNSSSAQLSQMFIPILGAQALLVDIISGDSTSFVHVIITSATSLLLALIFGLFGVMILKREKTIFS
ncbi:MAG: hypothetical protein COA42_18935 [Alteromonadaceae bacterium]|nr:MAG: hypothetical protein COA42_18935 [Alteromonadaceae bacterium]